MLQLLPKDQTTKTEEISRRRGRTHYAIPGCKPIISRRMLALMLVLTTALFTTVICLSMRISHRSFSITEFFAPETPYHASTVSLANRSRTAAAANFETERFNLVKR